MPIEHLRRGRYARRKRTRKEMCDGFVYGMFTWLIAAHILGWAALPKWFGYVFLAIAMVCAVVFIRSTLVRIDDALTQYVERRFARDDNS